MIMEPTNVGMWEFSKLVTEKSTNSQSKITQLYSNNLKYDRQLGEQSYLTIPKFFHASDLLNYSI